MRISPIVLLFALVFGFEASRVVTLYGADWRFSVRFSDAVHTSAFTGRAYIFFSRLRPQPRLDPDWFVPEQFIARDVTNWKPGAVLEFKTDDPRVLAFPKPLRTLDLGGYRAQAVARFNPWERRIGRGPGNGYSQTVSIPEKGVGPAPTFVVDRLVPPNTFLETDWCRELNVRSKLLSDFHHREVTMSAAVLLPPSYQAKSDRRYATIFTVPGFGGTHYVRRQPGPVAEHNRADVEFLRVLLDPSCPLGHHVFADSENNGPVGRALVTEFIPAFDRAFRSLPDARARFLTGHSSGGWSTLWLQTAYPDDFGGTWSTSPDPVDFRDFQLIDIYKPGTNMYVDAAGNERPLARINGKVVLKFRDFAQMETVLGSGGQLFSFEAVFSPRGADGQPQPLWNRKTGAIDPTVANAWQRYDIRRRLELNWQQLAPKLAGKLHVLVGSEDTFYLDGATQLLKESLARLGSDAVVEIHPGRDHSTLVDAALTRRIRREMVEAFLKSYPRSEPAPVR